MELRARTTSWSCSTSHPVLFPPSAYPSAQLPAACVFCSAPHRTPAAPQAEPAAPPPEAAPAQPEPAAIEADDKLTAQERAARVRALQEGLKKPDADAAAGGAAAASDADMPAADVVATDGAVQADAAADAAADAEAKTELETPAAPLDPAEARRAA